MVPPFLGVNAAGVVDVAAAEVVVVVLGAVAVAVVEVAGLEVVDVVLVAADVEVADEVVAGFEVVEDVLEVVLPQPAIRIEITRIVARTTNSLFILSPLYFYIVRIIYTI